MKRLLLPFLLLALPAGCPSTPTGPTCAQVCTHAAELGCSFARPSPKGVPCTTVCENLRASGLPGWNLTCMNTAASCPAMEVCQ